MSEHENRPTDDMRAKSDESVANPFAVDDEAEQEPQKISMSPRRAAMLGTSFGLMMVALLLVCFLGSAALASCTGV